MLSTNGVSLSSLELNGMVSLGLLKKYNAANSPALNEIIQAWRFTLFGHIVIIIIIIIIIIKTIYNAHIVNG